MFRILIVDDEKDERNVIKFLLNKYNFELEINEAMNGKEALSQLRRNPVDILFTDVKMPFIDGMELAAKAKDLYPDIQIIFFSGHDDFDYIKKALSLRAVNYILKPVKPVEFQSTISSVIQNIINQEKEKEERALNKEFLKTHILYRLINKTPMDILKNEYPSINFSFLNDYSRLILMQFEEPFFDRLPKEEDTLIFYEQLKKITPNYSCDFINLNQFQILMFFKTGSNTFVPIMEIANKIQRHVFTEYKINCYLSVSKELTNPSEIPTFYDELEKYLEDRFYYSDTYIYPTDTSTTESNEYLEEDEQFLQAIQTAIRVKDPYVIRENMNQLFQKYRNKKGISKVYVRFLFSNLLQILCKPLPSYNKKSVNDLIEAIYSCQRFSEIEEILINVQSEVIKNLKEEDQSPNHVIQLVKKYINEHYEEDLNLNLLAETVYLSPGYLSELFIQETGSGINKYIKNLRMEKAKDLLHNTNMKINDICEKVGYQNISYFCRSFREHFGSSPEKYRQMQRK